MNLYFNSDEFSRDKFELALSFLDKIILLCPDYADFKLNEIIDSELDDNIRMKINDVQNEIQELLLNKFQYVEIKGDRILFLTDKGREVKGLGGHSKYIDIVENEKQDSLKFKKRTEEKLNYELEMNKFEKSFGKKIKIWGFIFAFITVLISVILPLVFDITKIIDTKKQEININQMDSIKRLIKNQESRIKLLELKLNNDTIQNK